MSNQATPGTAMPPDRAPTGRAPHLYWAVLLIWSAAVVGADGLGLLPQVGTADVWNWVFLGAGVLAVVGCARRLIAADRDDPDVSDYAFAGAMLVLGLGGFVSAWLVTSVVLLVLGLLVLVSDARRSAPAAG